MKSFINIDKLNKGSRLIKNTLSYLLKSSQSISSYEGVREEKTCV